MERLVPLDTLAAQEKGFVRSLSGGHGFVSRLAALGFTPGAPLTIVQNRGGGPLIVLVRDCRIALGRGEAHKVLVQQEGRTHGPSDG
jgi:ferrous iron transport protein A